MADGLRYCALSMARSSPRPESAAPRNSEHAAICSMRASRAYFSIEASSNPAAWPSPQRQQVASVSCTSSPPKFPLFPRSIPRARCVSLSSAG